MTRLLTTTALGLLLGLTPALAQTDTPVDEGQAPSALQQPATPPDVAPVNPSEPAQPIPDTSADAPSGPDALADDDDAMPKATTLDEPKSISPEDAIEDSASLDQPQFLSKQEPGDWLATNLIGQPVVNSSDQAIGDINDLVTDENGRVIAVIIGTGGFLGLGQKDVAVRFEDLQYARDEDNATKVVANLSNEILASAPDYETLAEQEMKVGAADDDTDEERLQ